MDQLKRVLMEVVRREFGRLTNATVQHGHLFTRRPTCLRFANAVMCLIPKESPRCLYSTRKSRDTSTLTASDAPRRHRMPARSRNGQSCGPLDIAMGTVSNVRSACSATRKPAASNGPRSSAMRSKGLLVSSAVMPEPQKRRSPSTSAIGLPR